MQEGDLKSGTWITFQDEGEPEAVNLRRCLVEVTAGPDAGKRVELAQEVIRVGAKPGNDLILADRKVSGLHIEITLDDRGYRMRDLESTNGTYIYGLRVNDAYLQPGTRITLGKSELHFVPLENSVRVPLYAGTEFGRMVGHSVPMRGVFTHLEKIGPSEVTALITGETGTGKELVAEAIHESSARSEGPLVVVDCGAIPGSLFENELFGHEKGAFTGATDASPGAFERAHGGTLFLDEIGELPLSLQPKLLRAVQTRHVRRIGGTETIECDVRLVAATNRDLALEVNRGTFREDLYYRLAVARIHVPPLRDRRDDIPYLIEHFRDILPGGKEVELAAELVSDMMTYYWPGNVRELRNVVERAVLLPNYPPELGRGTPSGGRATTQEQALAVAIDTSVPFKVAKRRFVDEFDRQFMTQLLEDHDWNITAAARATGVDRVSIYKLLNRLGIERG